MGHAVCPFNEMISVRGYAVYVSGWCCPHAHNTLMVVLVTDNVRTWAASDGRLIPQMVPLLDSESVSVQVQALRAIGNLCFEQGI